MRYGKPTTLARCAAESVAPELWRGPVGFDLCDGSGPQRVRGGEIIEDRSGNANHGVVTDCAAELPGLGIT